MLAPINAAIPPVMCTTPEPAKSMRPLPPMTPAVSHPLSLHTQCATTGYTKPWDGDGQRFDGHTINHHHTDLIMAGSQTGAHEEGQVQARREEPPKAAAGSVAYLHGEGKGNICMKLDSLGHCPRHDGCRRGSKGPLPYPKGIIAASPHGIPRAADKSIGGAPEGKCISKEIPYQPADARICHVLFMQKLRLFSTPSKRQRRK